MGIRHRSRTPRRVPRRSDTHHDVTPTDDHTTTRTDHTSGPPTDHHTTRTDHTTGPPTDHHTTRTDHTTARCAASRDQRSIRGGTSAGHPGASGHRARPRRSSSDRREPGALAAGVGARDRWCGCSSSQPSLRRGRLGPLTEPTPQRHPEARSARAGCRSPRRQRTPDPDEMEDLPGRALQPMACYPSTCSVVSPSIWPPGIVSSSPSRTVRSVGVGRKKAHDGHHTAVGVRERRRLRIADEHDAGDQPGKAEPETDPTRGRPEAGDPRGGEQP